MRYEINAETPERRVRSVLICGAGPAGLLFTQYLRKVLGYEGALFVSDPNATSESWRSGWVPTTRSILVFLMS